MPMRVLILSSLFQLACFAGVIEQLVTCTVTDPDGVYETVTVTGPTYCFAAFPGPSSFAQVNFGLTIGTVEAGGFNDYFGVASGHISYLEEDWYFTDGPVRDGLIFIATLITFEGGPISVQQSVGQYSFGCLSGITCGSTQYYPFQLGVPFEETVQISGGTSGGAGIIRTATYSRTWSYQIYELGPDGQPGLPVGYQPVPEASAATLTCLGLAALAAAAFLRRSSSQPS